MGMRGWRMAARVLLVLCVLHSVWSDDRMPDAPDRLQRLASWMEENGAVFDAVELHDYGDMGVGLRASKDIEEGEVVMRIPRDIGFTIDHAMRSPVGDLYDGPQVYTLALFLMHEQAKGMDSFWQPYFGTLPTTLSTPLYYGAEERAVLEGSPMLEEISTWNETTRTDFERLERTLFTAHRDVFPEDAFTVDRFIHALSLIMSRAFHLRISEDDPDVRYTMVPLADLMNHNSEHGALLGWDRSLEAFQYRAVRRIAKGDQVFDSYGERSNHLFLFNYGFALPDNTRDRVEAVMYLQEDDPLYGKKRAILRRLGFAGLPLYTDMHEYELPRDLHVMMRVSALTEEELPMFVFAAEDRPITLRNELVALQNVLMWCDFLLARYPRTDEQDRAMLATGTLSASQVSAMHTVLGERRVLCSVQRRVHDEWRDVLLTTLGDERDYSQMRGGDPPEPEPEVYLTRWGM